MVGNPGKTVLKVFLQNQSRNFMDKFCSLDNHSVAKKNHKKKYFGGTNQYQHCHNRSLKSFFYSHDINIHEMACHSFPLRFLHPFEHLRLEATKNHNQEPTNPTLQQSACIPHTWTSIPRSHINFPPLCLFQQHFLPQDSPRRCRKLCHCIHEER